MCGGCQAQLLAFIMRVNKRHIHYTEILLILYPGRNHLHFFPWKSVLVYYYTHIDQYSTTLPT